MYKCDCGKKFEKWQQKANHVRWYHLKKTYNSKRCDFCDMEKPIYLIERHENKCIDNPNNFKYCKNCGDRITNTGNLFCGRSCSAVFNNKLVKRDYTKTKNVECIDCQCSIEINNRASSKYSRCVKCKEVHKNYLQNEYDKKDYKYTVYNHKCIICDVKFKHKSKNIKTCGNNCYRQLISRNSRKNIKCGGETNYYKYDYKGIIMDSSWEVDLAKWMDSKKIEWVRDKKIYFNYIGKDKKQHRYHPDFYVPKLDLYLDPKNKYLVGQDKYKLNQVIKEYKINLIYGELEYIKEQIGAWDC